MESCHYEPMSQSPLGVKGLNLPHWYIFALLPPLPVVVYQAQSIRSETGMLQSYFP